MKTSQYKVYVRRSSVKPLFFQWLYDLQNWKAKFDDINCLGFKTQTFCVVIYSAQQFCFMTMNIIATFGKQVETIMYGTEYPSTWFI